MDKLFPKSCAKVNRAVVLKDGIKFIAVLTMFVVQLRLTFISEKYMVPRLLSMGLRDIIVYASYRLLGNRPFR